MTRHKEEHDRREAEDALRTHEEHMRDVEDEQKKSNELGRKREEDH